MRSESDTARPRSMCVLVYSCASVLVWARTRGKEGRVALVVVEAEESRFFRLPGRFFFVAVPFFLRSQQAPPDMRFRARE